MKPWISLIIVATGLSGAGHRALATPAPSAGRQPIDSGRYGVEAACDPAVASVMKCGVSIRDLVYDTVLAETELGFTPGGALGSALAFDGNPAKGPKQTVTIRLDPSAVADRVRFQVEVMEEKHLVRTYAFVVPVATN
jgi:hypothetical protein